MDLNKIALKAEEFARSEINKYNVPEMTHLDISLEKGIWIAEKLNANIDIVKIGVCLMDVKLGQAFHEKKIPEHVKMSSLAAKEFLSSYSCDHNTTENVINCIEAHHGKIPFKTIEAEITANADCYRFISPKGVFFYFTVLGRRFGDDLPKILDTIESKMDEKMAIVSLPLVKEDLEPIYKNFKVYLKMAK